MKNVRLRACSQSFHFKLRDWPSLLNRRASLTENHLPVEFSSTKSNRTLDKIINNGRDQMNTN